MKRRLTAVLALAALCATGALAALALAPAALAWSPSNLPPGWTVHHIMAINTTTCPERYQIFEYTAGVFKDVSPELCTDSPTFQQDFDGWVNARYNPPASSTALPEPTTTVVITTTTPAATTAGSTTTSAPTDAPAAPAPQPTTVVNNTTTVVTVVTTLTPVEQSLTDQLAAVAAQIAALTDRVTRLEKAGDAAWLAFQQAVEGGADPAAAAATARGTWLNAIYGLGAFAP